MHNLVGAVTNDMACRFESAAPHLTRFGVGMHCPHKQWLGPKEKHKSAPAPKECGDITIETTR